MSLKNKFMKTYNFTSKGKNKVVDLSKRIQRGFGSPVLQKVEIHYQGQPRTFYYDGPIEEISIDVIHKQQREEKIKESIKNKDLGEDIHPEESIEIEPTNIEPDPNSGIDEFEPKKIRFYKLFPKKTNEIKYIATYDQDILAEAPQPKMTETSGGSKYIRNFERMIMIFIFGLLEVITIISFISSTTPSFSSQNTTNTWYIPIAITITMLVILWIVHVRDVSRTHVKYVNLQSGPFLISNTGIIPVIMTNTVVRPFWDYQKQVMNVDDKHAKDVFYSLQKWNEEQIQKLSISNKIMDASRGLSELVNEERELTRLNLEYKGVNSKSPSFFNVVLAGIVVFVGYTMTLLFMGVI